MGGFLVHCDQGAEVEEGGVSIVPQDRIPERLLVGSFSHTTCVFSTSDIGFFLRLEKYELESWIKHIKFLTSSWIWKYLGGANIYKWDKGTNYHLVKGIQNIAL